MNGNPISIKDYASRKSVSYEAVRKQVVRYKDELDEHITVVNRTQYLDQFAVEFLDRKRAESPIIVQEEARIDEIEELKAKVEALTNQLLTNQQKLVELQDIRVNLIEQNNQQQLLIAKNEQKVADYDRTYEAWANANMQRINAESEAEKLRQEKQNVEHNFNTLMEQSRQINAEQEAKIQQLENMTPREFKKYKKQLKKEGRL